MGYVLGGIACGYHNVCVQWLRIRPVPKLQHHTGRVWTYISCITTSSAGLKKNSLTPSLTVSGSRRCCLEVCFQCSDLLIVHQAFGAVILHARDEIPRQPCEPIVMLGTFSFLLILSFCSDNKFVNLRCVHLVQKPIRCTHIDGVYILYR